MENTRPTTAIFLIGSGIYMLDFYNFNYLKTISNYNFVAIVNENVADSFPEKQKYFFNTIHVVSENNTSSLWNLNLDEVDEAVKIELNQVGNSNTIRIFPFNEYNVLIAANIRDKYGIPGANYKSLNPFRDKFIMKSILAENNIRIPRFVSLDLKMMIKYFKKYFDEITAYLGIPFIVKPVDGAGGLGVKKISSQDDFAIFQEELLTTVSGYEAEEFLDGELFHCDVVYKDHNPILSLCAKYNYPLLDFKNGKNVGSIPLLDGHPLKQGLIQFTHKALQCFRVPDGIIHTEIFYLPKTKEFVFLESAARAPGASIVPMYERTFGFNLLDLDFLIHMDQTPVDVEIFNAYCFWAVFPPISGKVKHIIEPKIESAYKLEWFAKKGEVLSTAGSMRDRVGRIFVWNQDYAALQRDFEYISNNNFIEVEL
jgi:biotin carboxylase